jgi:hypothetical protein
MRFAAAFRGEDFLEALLITFALGSGRPAGGNDTDDSLIIAFSHGMHKRHNRNTIDQFVGC